MQNFTKSAYEFNGHEYIRYTGDRKRGGQAWVFYNNTPHDTTYWPTWPVYVQSAPEFSGVFFISKINEDEIHVDFSDELTGEQENALDNLYQSHVGPVSV